jgi:hypothetical protein
VIEVPAATVADSCWGPAAPLLLQLIVDAVAERMGSKLEYGRSIDVWFDAEL